MQTHHVDISWTSILRFVAIVLGLLLLWKILNIVALLFVVLIVVAALGPWVDTLTGYGLPRGLSVGIIYIFLFGFLAFLFSLLLPPLVSQLQALSVAFPVILTRITPLYELVIQSNTGELLQSLSTELGAFTQSVFAATAQVFGGAAATLTVMVLSFYILLDASQVRATFIPLIPGAKVKSVSKLIDRIWLALGSWLRGQLMLSLAIGLITYLGLLILGVPFALTLAVLAGLLEIIPFVGPILAGLVAIVVAYASGTWQLALGTAVFYTVVQQVENHFLVPKIMQSAIGLSPVLIIIALAVGAQLGGTIGAVLAIPLAAVIQVFFQEWPRVSKA